MKFSSDNRIPFYSVAWACVLCLAAIFSIYKVLNDSPFYSNLMELLPRDEQSPVLDEFTRRLADRFQNRVLILVLAKTDRESRQQADYLQAQLSSSEGFKQDSADTDWVPVIQGAYHPYVSRLLSVSSRSWLATHTPEQLATDGLKALLSPVATPRPYSFKDDPFNLGGAWLNQVSAGDTFSLYNGHPTVEDNGRRWFVISAELEGSPFSLTIQQHLQYAMRRFKQQYPTTQVLTSGMAFHAAEGTEQAKREISSVGLGSILGIVLLIGVVFRSAYPLLLVLLVLASACLVALSTSLLVFGRVHLLTLAFGSTLLGVSVDYAFHFLVNAQRLGSGRRARSHIQSALAVGVITSVVAYLMQLFTPFPGLQQMAVFSASGLLGAWITVLCFGDFYSPERASASKRQLERSCMLSGRFIDAVYQNLRPHRAAVCGVLLVLFIGSGYAIVHIGSNDNVASLNTSGRTLLESERKMQLLLRQPSSSRFFLVGAADREALIQKLERLDEHIKAQFPNVATRSIASYVPSLKRQRENADLIRDKLYRKGAALDNLCDRLAMDCTDLRQKLLAQEASLLPEAFRNTPLATLFPPVLPVKNGVKSLLAVDTSHISPAELHAVAGDITGVQFIDRGKQLSSLLARYRQHVSVMLCATLVVLAAAIGIRYRRRAWQVLAPLLLSMTIAMGCAAVGGGLTVFHMAALLLVLGIGADTAVFYIEVGLQGESWLAATLSSLTSLLAFGLLSLSEVPVLQQFGSVIFSGILSCWLLTPLFFPKASISATLEGTRQ